MEKMYSPWRSQYIESFKDKTEKKCIFCDVESLNPVDESNLVIYKGKYCFIIMNLYPYNNGHLMIVPYRHLSDISHLTDDENLEIMKFVQGSIKALKEVMMPEGFNMGANLGKCGGAGIDQHIHFHVVPRWNGDTNFMPAIGEVKIISQDILVTKRNLIKVIGKYCI